MTSTVAQVAHYTDHPLEITSAASLGPRQVIKAVPAEWHAIDPISRPSEVGIRMAHLDRSRLSPRISRQDRYGSPIRTPHVPRYGALS